MNQEQLTAKWPAARHWLGCALAGLVLALWPSYDSFRLWGESYNLGFLIPAGGFQVIGASSRTPVETWQIVGKGPLLIAAVFWCCLFHFGTKVRKWALKESSWCGAATQAGVALSSALMLLGVVYWSFPMAQEWLLNANDPARREQNYRVAVAWLPVMWMSAGLGVGLFVLWDGRKRPDSLKVFHGLLALSAVAFVTIVAQPHLNHAVNFFDVVANSARQELTEQTVRNH